MLFDKYAKDLEKWGAEVPKVFKRVAKKGAVKFVKEAQDLTDKEGLVDTGAYKGHWAAKEIELEDGTEAVLCSNSMDYSMLLEKGYTIKKDHFVPFDKMEGTPKTKALIASFKAKYPKAKGFIAKAGRYKGKFIGRQAIGEAVYYCIEQLDKEFEKAVKTTLKGE